MYKTMRALERKPPKQVVCLEGESGDLIEDPINIRRCFQNKIAKLTNGSIVTVQQLVQIANEVSIEISNDDRLQVLDFLPNEGMIESICACVASFRACGEDTVPGELLKYYPKQVAKIIYPLIVQVMSNFQEPLAWLGGISQELLKGSLPSRKVTSFRMVMLADVIGKTYHKYLRTLLTPYINTYALSSMCGGIMSRGTDFASIYVNAFQDFARYRRASWAIVFLDVKAAFESVQRPFLFGSRVSDEQVAGVFRQCGMPAQVFAQFRDAIQSPGALQEAGVPSVLCKLVEASHAITWYSFNGLDTMVATKQGVKPGDPLGDILFAFIVCRILRKIKAQMPDLTTCMCDVPGTSSVLGEFSAQNVDMSSINYVDDCAFPIWGDRAEDVVLSVQKLAACVLDSFASYVMHCTLASNKTAVLLALLGKYQRKLLRNPELFREHEGQMTLRVVCTVKGECFIPVVKKYKHVGRMVVANCSNNEDVKHHVIAGHASLGSLGRNVIGNLSIPESVRLKFSLIPLAKMLASSGAWYNLSLTGIRALDTQYNKIYRTAYMGHQYFKNANNNLTNAQFYTKYPHKNVMACVRGRRLRLLLRLVHTAPEPLKALIAASEAYQKSFIRELVDDLQWLWKSQSFPVEFKMQDPGNNPNQWFQFISKSPSLFKTRIRCAEEVECLALVLPESCKNQGMQCPECGFYCKNVHVYSGHMARVHGFRSPLKLRIAGSVCAACMKDFRTRNRLYHHLHCNSKRCGKYYMQNVPVLDNDTYKKEEAATAADEKALKAQGKPAFFAELPVIRLPGPVPVRPEL